METISAIWWWCFRKLKSARAAVEFAISHISTRRPLQRTGKMKRLFLRTLLVLSMVLFMSPVFVHTGGGAGTGLPSFTYTGTFTQIDDGEGNWRVKFLTSGTLVFSGNVTLDVFCVGGGGGGNSAGTWTGGGGAGGYTVTVSGVVTPAGTPISVVVGAGGAASSNGGTTYFKDLATANAAGGSGANGANGGNGGSGGGGGDENSPFDGGNGGSDGSSGTTGSGGYWAAGTGQGTTTKEFGESTGTLYAGGGGAAGGTNRGNRYGLGGAGGGANGSVSGTNNGAANTGGGGGASGNSTGGSGGSGICVIRNHRVA